jgi:DNA-binding SARP family transcriptional activator
VRYQLYQNFERICLSLARGELDRRQPQAALDAVEALLQVSPNQEAAWRLSMRAYNDLGDRSGIERAYQRCRDALSLALEVEPSEETDALYRALMA